MTEGFDRWRRFHARFGEQEQRLRQLDPGQATWDDVATFATDHLGGAPVNCFTALSFDWNEGEVREASYQARVLSLRGDGAWACGDYGGIPVTNATGRRADQLGLNVPAVAEALRRLAFPAEPTGAAYVRWPEDIALPQQFPSRPFAVSAAVRQSVRFSQGMLSEVGTSLHILVVPRNQDPLTVDGPAKATLVRALQRATIRRDPTPDLAFLEHLEIVQNRWIDELRRPSDAEREDRVRHAVTPLVVAIVD